MQTPSLHYDKKLRQFFLTTAQVEKLARTLEAHREWRLYKPGTYVTDLIPEAHRFRRYADVSTENFFKRAYVEFYPVPPKKLPGFLDPHQVEGVTWILTRQRSYLAHAPGAGKTAQAIIASLYLSDPGQTVFIVPPTLTTNWETEIIKFLDRVSPNYWPKISVVRETAKAEFVGWNADFIIVPDSMLTKPWVQEKLAAMTIKLLAVDEASRFKEPGSIRAVALFGGTHGKMTFNGLVKRAARSVLLDGSPMPNRPMELWAPTYAMMPEVIDFMSQRQFGFRYCGAVMNDRGNWEFKHASHEEELRARLQEKFMHVVTEGELDHPERLRSLIFLNEDGRSKECKAWERKHLTKIDPEELGEEDSQGELATWRKEYGLCVVPAALKYIKERLEGGEVVLVFAWHREVVQALHKGLAKYDPSLVIGGMERRERDAQIKEFQDGGTDAMVMNIEAGSRGHNLQRADRVIMVEPSWTDETNKQCEKRASRKGRDAALTVKCDYLAVRGSFIERVLHAAFTKEKRVRRIIG